ncbi:hypothetical protein [Infirmifilum uzonense]|nr:hypothetical protein [Infirmifilum uzonense]
MLITALTFTTSQLVADRHPAAPSNTVDSPLGHDVDYPREERIED